MSWNAQPYFTLILDALDHIEAYRPADREESLASPMAQDAIILRLQVIGENLRQLHEKDGERFDRSADQAWTQFIGLRHRISHGYQSVDQVAVWQIVDEEMGAFRETIESVIDRY